MDFLRRIVTLLLVRNGRVSSTKHFIPVPHLFSSFPVDEFHDKNRLKLTKIAVFHCFGTLLSHPPPLLSCCDGVFGQICRFLLGKPSTLTIREGWHVPGNVHESHWLPVTVQLYGPRVGLGPLVQFRRALELSGPRK